MRRIEGVGRLRTCRRALRRRCFALAALAFALMATAAFGSSAALGVTAAPIRHVWVINLENFGFCQTPLEEPSSPPECPPAASRNDPAFTSLLFPAGTLIANYYGIGHESLDNYIAEVSGQAPSPQTQDDCASGWGTEFTPGVAAAPEEQWIGQGCNFPANVKTIADQLQTQGLSWKGYEEDMGNNLIQDGGRAACATRGSDQMIDSYVPKHDNFIWFHSTYDNLAYCEAHVVALTALRADLQRVQTTPNLSFITPNMADDGHDGVTWDLWLPHYIHIIQASPAYRQDGMIVVVFDEASGTGTIATNNTACCGEVPGPNSSSPGVGGPGGGDTGAVVLSPYAPAGVRTDANSYNHYSLLRTLEDVFGVTTGGADGEGHLGYAAGNGVQPNTSVGFRSFGCDDIFTVLCPPTGGAVPPPAASGQSLGAGPRPADGSTQWLNPAPQGDDLNGVSCADSTHCVAVGASGSVISTSTGSSWVAGRSGTVADLNGVSCPAGGSTCVAVGAGGIVLKTSNGGGTWSTAQSGTTHDLTGVSCPTTSACYAVGAAGTILASSDGGATWTDQSSPTTFGLDQISCPTASTCYASGDVEAKEEPPSLPALRAYILATHDAGADWSVAAFPEARARAIACVGESWCAAGSESGRVATTSDGQTWSSTQGSYGRLLGMSCLASKACVGVGEYGSVVSTADGTHWTHQTLPSEVDLHSISCPSQSACYAVGQHGVVLTSADQGASWATASRDGAASNIGIEGGGSSSAGGDVVGSADLAGVSCADTSSCVAVGDLGAILASHDGGASWSLRGGVLNVPLQSVEFPALPSFEPSARPLRAVSCPTSTACVAVGDLGTIEQSSDGGQSWSLASSPTAHMLAAVSCANGTSTCFAAGDYGTILRSGDGGLSWSAQSSGTTSFLNAISCAEATRCVAVGADGVIITTKNGASWTKAATPTSAYLAAVSCPARGNCFAVGQGGTVLHGVRAASSWSARSAPSGDDVYGVSCSSVKRCVLTGAAGTVASTANAGRTWRLQGTGTTDVLRGVACPLESVCYAAGDFGSILKITPR
jgi:photosystem II stability/assembly factor-like uncharacterized protein